MLNQVAVDSRHDKARLMLRVPFAVDSWLTCTRRLGREDTCGRGHDAARVRGKRKCACSNAEGGADKHGGSLRDVNAAACVYLVHNLGQVSGRPQNSLGHSH